MQSLTSAYSDKHKHFNDSASFTAYQTSKGHEQDAIIIFA